MLHRRAVATAVGLAVGLGLAGTGAAANEVRYIGEFSGPIQYVDCVDPQPGNHVAGGTWRANVHEKSVTARFVITVDGQPHVAWTAPMERVAPSVRLHGVRRREVCVRYLLRHPHRVDAHLSSGAQNRRRGGPGHQGPRQRQEGVG